eukprot:48847-Amphidinium_carterae.2
MCSATRSSPIPKKGKSRLYAKPAASIKSSAYKRVKYVRHGQRSTKSRNDRRGWTMGLMTILSATEDELVHTCLDHRMLPSCWWT